MVLTKIPVIPPVCPMVQRTAAGTSDLNDRRHQHNTRPKRLLEGCPGSSSATRSMLQRSVDAHSASTTVAVVAVGSEQPSAEVDLGHAQGAWGRFRQNLLGKQRSTTRSFVIVVGPQPQPHHMRSAQADGLELFVMKAWLRRTRAERQGAKRRSSVSAPVDVLDDVIRSTVLSTAPLRSTASASRRLSPS